MDTELLSMFSCSFLLHRPLLVRKNLEYIPIPHYPIPEVFSDCLLGQYAMKRFAELPKALRSYYLG